MIVLDTHIWIWFLTGDKRLPEKLRSQIETSPEKTILSAISIWECLVLAEKKRIDLGNKPEQLLREALNEYNFQDAPITKEIAILSRTLKFKHSDPADRIIAATAFAYQAKLATSDKYLKKLSWLKTF